MRPRIFNIMQYADHPDTGEQLITEDKIKEALTHKTIKQWAYIAHNKDVYSEEDEKEEGRRQGELKPLHYHIVLNCPGACELSAIAKWFGIAENYVDVPKGHGAFLDCVQYLTHEQAKQQEQGKVLYSDEDVISNFDFRKILNERAERILKYGKDLDARQTMRYDVLYCGKTLKQCINEDKLQYMEDLEKLKKLRLEYISMQNPPKTRINYYISGRGGIGKGLISRAISRSLYPDLIDDYDIFFEVGSKGSAFEGYDGQPVIIWNDRRAIDLLTELNGRGNVFNVFDTHPTKQRQNVKYSSINLCNEVNIINGIESYTDFLDGLAGEYKDKSGGEHKSEDKSQSYRRFPFIIPMHTMDIDIMINKGFMGDSKNYEEYEQYKRIIGNMQKISVACGNNEKLVREIEARTIRPITEKHKEITEKEKNPKLSEDELREQFKDYGVEIEIEELKEDSKNNTEEKQGTHQVDLIEYSQKQAEDDLNKRMGFDDDITAQDFFG